MVARRVFLLVDAHRKIDPTQNLTTKLFGAHLSDGLALEISVLTLHLSTRRNVTYIPIDLA